MLISQGKTFPLSTQIKVWVFPYCEKLDTHGKSGAGCQPSWILESTFLFQWGSWPCYNMLSMPASLFWLPNIPRRSHAVLLPKERWQSASRRHPTLHRWQLLQASPTSQILPKATQSFLISHTHTTIRWSQTPALKCTLQSATVDTLYIKRHLTSG